MAYEEKLCPISRPAAADLSTHQYKLVRLNGSGEIALCTAGQAADGVLQDNPLEGEAGAFAIGGVSPVVAGAAFGAGVDLTTGSNGTAVAAGTGDPVVARSIEAASGANSVVSALLVLSREPLS